jgi:hypothetical protein
MVHFVVLGAALFWISGSGAARSILIDQGEIQRLAAAWSAQWQRPPTQAELNGLIQERVREEVLYREALEMGLERGDAIVRRRLAQKIQFLYEDLADEHQPSEAELRSFFDQHRGDFNQPAHVSFRHVFYSTDRPGVDPSERARTDRAALEDGRLAPEQAGDRFLLDKVFDGQTQDQISREFGEDFARAVFALEPGHWQGPLKSGFGLHLIRVSESSHGRERPFESVRGEVLDAWTTEHRRRANEESYERLRGKYDIRIEGLPE